MNKFKIPILLWCSLVQHLISGVVGIGEAPRFLSGSSFRRGSTWNSNLEVMDTHVVVSGSGTCVKCATLCRDRTHYPCPAFRCLPLGYKTTRCELYKQGSNVVPGPGNQVFLLKYTDTFHVISYGGQLFTIYLSSVAKTFFQARTHCNQMGGYLLQYDSLEEFHVVDWVTSGPYEGWYFVGANDLDIEGLWKTDKDGIPIDPNLWRWDQNEPNNYGGNENCMTTNTHGMSLHDSDCSRPHYFWCERDVDK